MKFCSVTYGNVNLVGNQSFERMPSLLDCEWASPFFRENQNNLRDQLGHQGLVAANLIWNCTWAIYATDKKAFWGYWMIHIWNNTLLEMPSDSLNDRDGTKWFFFATSQTVYLFLPRLTDGTARIYFHREREISMKIPTTLCRCRDSNSRQFELTSVELAPLFVGP